MSANDSDSARLTAQGPGLLTALRRYAALVLLCVVLAAGLGVLVTYLLPRHYTADAQLLLGDDNAPRIFGTTPNLNATAKAQNAAQIARSKAVHDRASLLLGKRLSSDDVSNSVTASPGETGNPLVTISATEKTAKLARDATNAVGQAYLDVTSGQRLAQGTNKLAALQAPVTSLQAQLDKINSQESARQAVIAAQASKITDPSDRSRYVVSGLAADSDYQSLVKQGDDLTSSIATLNPEDHADAHRERGRGAHCRRHALRGQHTEQPAVGQPQTQRRHRGRARPARSGPRWRGAGWTATAGSTRIRVAEILGAPSLATPQARA